MKMLAEDGWRLVRQGITTVEEVLSVTTAKEVARTANESRSRSRVGDRIRRRDSARGSTLERRIDQMPTFSYRALQADGKMAEGQLDAAGRPDALRQMEALGLRPVNLSEKAARGRQKRFRLCRRAWKTSAKFRSSSNRRRFRPRNWKISRGCCPVCSRPACR